MTKIWFPSEFFCINFRHLAQMATKVCFFYHDLKCIIHQNHYLWGKLQSKETGGEGSNRLFSNYPDQKLQKLIDTIFSQH